jgi:hypothetical protein
VITGFSNIDYLSTFAWEAGVDLVRPDLIFSQTPKMFFQKEQGVFFSFGVANI